MIQPEETTRLHMCQRGIYGHCLVWWWLWTIVTL